MYASFYTCARTHAGAVGIEHVRSLFFGDFIGEAGAGEDEAGRLYDEYTDVPALMSRVEEYLTDHNATSKRPMNLAVCMWEEILFCKGT